MPFRKTLRLFFENHHAKVCGCVCWVCFPCCRQLGLGIEQRDSIIDVVFPHIHTRRHRQGMHSPPDHAGDCSQGVRWARLRANEGFDGGPDVNQILNMFLKATVKWIGFGQPFICFPECARLSGFRFLHLCVWHFPECELCPQFAIARMSNAPTSPLEPVTSPFANTPESTERGQLFCVFDSS